MPLKPYAIVNGSSLVVNCCQWDGEAEWSPPAGCTAVDISAVSPQPSIGWTYSGGTFTPPAPLPTPVPASITRFQAMAELSNAGLLATVTALIPSQTQLVQLAWANAQSFDRTSPTIAALAGPLGLTSAQLDALFIAAAQITA